MSAAVGGIGAAPGLVAWRSLGAEGGLFLEAAEVLRVELALQAPLGTAAGVHRARPVVLVRLACRRTDGMVVEGWGECAALADTTYDAEDATSCQDHLSTVLLPALAAQAEATGGLLASLSALERLADGGAPGAGAHERRDRPLAWAALEMAVADAHLRAAGRSLADLLGVGGAAVEPGAVVGTAPDAAQVVAAVEALADEGYGRVKVKIAPGGDVGPLGALAAWAADRAAGAPGAVTPRLHVDANGAYPSDAVAHLGSFDRFGLLCIEQPFGRHDLAASAALVAVAATPVCLDESVGSVDDLVGAVTRGAASAACIKPARLGGVGPALEAIAWCQARRVPWLLGGMFETGMARSANTVLAALDGPRLPGDLAPAASYLVEDIVPPAETSRPGPGAVLTVATYGGPGIGPAPDATVVGRSTSWRTALAVR